MRTYRTLAFALPIAILAACGGSGSSPEAAGSSGGAPGGSSGSPGSAAAPSGAAQLAAAAPTIAGVSLVDADADDASPTYVAPGPGQGYLGEYQRDSCDPHLFLRSEEVVTRVNRHLYKALVHVEDAIAREAATTTDTSATFVATRDGFVATLTVTATTTDSFSWTLDLAPVSSPSASVLVANGTVDTAGAAGPHQGSGTLDVNLTAIGTLTGDNVSGTLDAAFQVFPSYKLVNVQATDVVWDTDSWNPIRPLRPPLSSSYVSYRQTGVGGSLVVEEDEMVPEACPRDRYSMNVPGIPTPAAISAPALTSATIELVSRWYLAAPATTTTVTPVSGEVVMASPATTTLNGRTDAEFAGGPLALTDIAKVEALTCHQAIPCTAFPVEGEWLLKAEDASGNTLWGREFVAGAIPCDPALNELGVETATPVVPTLANSATDFDFTTVNFTKPYLGFPGAAYPPP